jgi:endo-beta-N-acetylglucosaminidase D
MIRWRWVISVITVPSSYDFRDAFYSGQNLHFYGDFIHNGIDDSSFRIGYTY